MQVTAVARPNIALVKYWGKQQIPGNRPAVPSLSVTLDTLYTRTELRFDAALDRDRFTLNDQPDAAAGARVSACLDALRVRAGCALFAAVSTRNSFPTGAGLASSASGFAALVVAADRALGLGLSRAELSRVARRSSGSAARSMYGGFVTLPLAGAGAEETAAPLRDAASWPLSVVVAVTATDAKPTGSTEGMERSARTSDYYPAWLTGAGADFQSGLDAVAGRDFGQLAQVAERSCLKMHGLMLSSDPGLIYWNPATVACLQRIRTLRRQGAAVFFTVDAGPQVKAVCLPEAQARVVAALESIPGVVEVLVSGLGAGAEVVATRA